MRRFEGFENFFGVVGDLVGDAGEFGDGDAITVGGFAFYNSMEEDWLILVFFDCSVVVFDEIGVFIFKCLELVVVGGEESFGFGLSD